MSQKKEGEKNVYRNDSQEYTFLNNRHHDVDPRSSEKVGRDEQVELRGVYGSETTLCGTVMVNLCLSTVVQTHRTYNTQSDP